MEGQLESSGPEIFVSYAREDLEVMREFEPHLALLRRQGRIRLWHDGKILPGSQWAEEIAKHLESADIVLFLVSADFIASDFCWGIEMRRALERHEAGRAVVIPVIVRPCLWDTAPFANLQVLPTGARPVSNWNNKDEAYTTVAEGIARVANGLMDAG